MRNVALALVIALAAPIGPVAAQTVASTEAAPAPRRERSEAQRRNDQVMRECGAEWRSSKETLAAQGKTWRTFLPECRARRRA